MISFFTIILLIENIIKKIQNEKKKKKKKNKNKNKIKIKK